MGTIEIIEPGFLFVYLSYENESDNWVYFDDLKITHTPTSIVQYNDYYPYGLRTNASWTREDSGNNRLYNQGNELNPSHFLGLWAIYYCCFHGRVSPPTIHKGQNAAYMYF